MLYKCCYKYCNNIELTKYRPHPHPHKATGCLSDVIKIKVLTDSCHSSGDQNISLQVWEVKIGNCHGGPSVEAALVATSDITPSWLALPSRQDADNKRGLIIKPLECNAHGAVRLWHPNLITVTTTEEKIKFYKWSQAQFKNVLIYISEMTFH